MAKLTKKIEREKLRKALDFVPHPNLIFAVLVDTSKTEGGVIKPDSAKDKTPTVEIVAMGKNVQEQFGEFVSVGSRCYVAAPYMSYAEINGTDMLVFHADGILGVKKSKIETIGEA